MSSKDKTNTFLLPKNLIDNFSKSTSPVTHNQEVITKEIDGINTDVNLQNMPKLVEEYNIQQPN